MLRINVKNRPMMTKLRMMLLALLATLTVTAADADWLSDATKAQALAKKQGKVVLLNFTGSDWCGWGIKLRREVFSTSEFAAYAKKNLVLVDVDFPRRKPVSDAQKETNILLAGKYQVRSFPTIILINGDGKKLGQFGFDDAMEDKQESDPLKIVAKPAALIAAIEKARRGA